MIERRIYKTVLDRLVLFPAVILLGPRPVGKTTLSEDIASRCPSVYLDLESRFDREKLSDPLTYFEQHEDKLVVLELTGGEIWAIEIKSGSSAIPSRGFYNAREDVQPDKSFVVYAGEERYPVSQDVEAIGVLEMAREISSISKV